MYKTSGGWSNEPYVFKHRNAGGSIVTDSSGTVPTICNLLTTTGYKTPYFRRRVRNGDLIPFTPFRQFSLTGSATYKEDFQSTTYPTSGVRTWNTDGSGGFALTPSIGHLDISEGALELYTASVDVGPFVQQAAAKIYTRSFDALTFLAELHKTIHMVTSAGRRLVKLVEAFRRRKPSESLSSLVSKEASNLWLEGRYGWRILLFDIQDISNTIQTLHEKKTRLTQRSGISYSSSAHSQVINDDIYHTAIHHTVDSVDVSLRGSVAADIDLPKLLFNPFATAWELVRFSFVVDWFIDVGQALEALSFLALQTNYTACTGISVTLTRTLSADNTTKAGYSTNLFERSGSAVAKLLIRTPCTVPTLPQPKLNLNVAKVTDLVALLLQLKRR